MCKIPANFRITAEMAACFAQGVDYLLYRRECYYNRKAEHQEALFAGKRMIFFMQRYDDYVPKSALKAYKNFAIEYIEARRNYEKAVRAFETIYSESFIDNLRTVELYLSDAIAA